MEELYEILKETIDTSNGANLRSQLALRAAWQARVSSLHRDAEEELDYLEGRTWGDGKTVDDKKMSQQLLCAESQAKADKLKDLAEILKNQINLGQSFLRSIESEVRANI